MSIQSRLMAAGVAVVLGLVLASCDRSPSSRPIPTGSSPTPGPTPTLIRVEVSAPPAIAPGESVQLTANAVKSDASVENVTGQTQWSTSNARVLQINSAGVARGVATGEALIFARYQNRSASAPTIVLPTGTFRLTGRISESGFGLENVAVEVISGVGEGLATVTSSNGGYALYGVRGPVRIHAKKDGYANRIEALDVVANRAFDFEVTADRPRADLTGTYALTIAAVPCRFGTGTLPDTALNRSYTARVAQDGPRLTVTLTDAAFIVTRDRGNHFAGFVDASGLVTFAIGDVYYYYYYGDSGQYDLVERFSDSSALLVSGIVTAKVTPSGMSGGLAGGIALARGTTAPFKSVSANCYADAHRFEMVRR